MFLKLSVFLFLNFFCDAQDNLKLSGIIIPDMLRANSDNKVQSLYTLAAKAYVQECSRRTVQDLLVDENFEWSIPQVITPTFVQSQLTMHVSYKEPNENYGKLVDIFRNIRHFKKSRHHFFFRDDKLVWEFRDYSWQWTKYIINEHYIVRRSRDNPQANVECGVFTITTKQLASHSFKSAIAINFSNKNPHILFCKSYDEILKIKCDQNIDNSIQKYTCPKWCIKKLYQTPDDTKHLIKVYTEKWKAQLYYININAMKLQDRAYVGHPIASNSQGTLFIFTNSDYSTHAIELLIFNNENFTTPLARLIIPYEHFFHLSSKIVFIGNDFLLIYDSFPSKDSKIRIYSLASQEEVACYNNTLQLHKFKMIDDQLVAYTKKNGLCFISFPQLHVFMAYKQVHERIKKWST